MKYKKYPSYKDSGVEWLGEIPSEWNESRLKFIGYTYGGLSGKAGKDFGDEENLESKRFIPFTNIANNAFIKSDNLGYVIINEKEEQNKVKINDLFFLMSSENYDDLGKASLLEENLKDTYLNSFCKGFRLTDKLINPRFLNYLLSGNIYRKLLSIQGNGFTRINLRLEKLNELRLLLPSLQEQQQIANFLDKATAKIDTLIEKQTKLIELLKEKRQAVISHAVTKGINPNVPMKDSGVEWLGEIPEHWEAKKLKFVLKLLNKKEKISNQIIIALENIESWSGKYIESESNYQGDDVAFCVGDILFGKLRPYLAKVFLCSFDGIAFGDLLAYRPTKDYASKYGFYSLISEDFIKIVDSSTYGTKMPRASSEFLSEMRLTVPPLKEQQQIVNYLDEKTLKIDTLIEKSKKSIELLKEKRTALISAAVTGKIDVRELV
ncbi:restriction endonuclease subunit S [Aliarcobacter cryaerophilus]|uniref:restriction endonuclease subunit S n=1 Tax=Aliarcobacter cryaerophilus TaxID=28198 RepID=UPI0013DDD154|nr:restriction endonuclease subunit S [Aliarcobacter cryaerophilus]